MNPDSTDQSAALAVYPLPPVLPTNPYLDLLYRPMQTIGVLVRRGRPRSELPALLVENGARLLHLHFFDELTQHANPAHSIARSLGFLTLLRALRGRGVRIVWTAHNLGPHEVRNRAMAELVYRTVARTTDTVIAHSAAALAMVRERYGPLRRAAAVPHGNYIGVYGPAQTREAGRAALGLPSGRVTLALGALRRYKRLEILIDAFAELPARTRGVLLIVGGPKDAAYAGELTRRAMRVPGVRLLARHIPDAEIALFLAAADLVALPYGTLLTSGALMLALSYGRPVLAPDTPVVRELARDQIEGFLFPPTGLASVFARALGYHDLDALGANALATAQRFDWNEIAARTVALYWSAVEGVP